MKIMAVAGRYGWEKVPLDGVSQSSRELPPPQLRAFFFGGEKMTLELKCYRCDKNVEPIVTTSGPHEKASCPECGRYIKFLSKPEIYETLNTPTDLNRF